MAKIGESDERWIVSRRSDGKNVDNWHWTERDLFPWCQEQFTSEFLKRVIPSSIALLTINKAETVKGNMTICNRKGKTIYIYDIQLKLEWEGSLKKHSELNPDNTQTEEKEETPAVSLKGTIVVDDIATDEEKFRWSIKTEDENSANRIIRDELQANFGPVINKVVERILNDMKAMNPIKEETHTVQPIMAAQFVKTGSRGGEILASFSWKVKVQAPLNELYDVFLNKSKAALFAGKSATTSDQVGGKFDLFAGLLTGENVEIVANQKITQKWRHCSYPENHYSNVVLEFSPETYGTLLAISHKEIPPAHLQSTKGHWNEFYFQNFSKSFGWNFEVLESEC